jgi:protein-S-isoprenylcysteine O-methyltransferase Ste14
MLLVAGWTLHIWSNLSLTRAERALTGPTGLAAQGPFRYVRNPIYLAGAPILLGIYFLYGDWRSDSESLVLLVVLALWFHFAVTRIEEPELRKRFGPAYEEYRRRVPRWLPRVP